MAEDTELRKVAKELAEKKFVFYIHIVVYIVVNSLLFFIWFFSGTESPWFIFPLVGWGIAVVLHFLSTFVFTEKKYLDGMAEKEYERLKRG